MSPQYPAPAVMTLPPSPLGLGQSMTSAIQILGRRIGLFIGLAFAPGLIVGIASLFVTVIGVAAIAGSTGLGTSQPTTGNIAGAIALVVVLVMAMTMVMLAIQIKFHSMSTLLAHETALDRRPDLSALNAGTRGVVGRTIPLILLAVLGVGVVFGVVGAIMAASISAMLRSGSSYGDPSAALGAMGLILLLEIAGAVAEVYFGTRWLYTYQALSIEGLGGIAALGRSWQLTKGNFWRTFGWLLAVAAIVYAALLVIMGVTSGLMAPAMKSASEGNSPMAGAAAGTSILFMLVMVVISALVGPALTCFVTVMYIDQRRRSEAAANGTPLLWQPQQYPGQPTYGTPAPGAYGAAQPGTYGAPAPTYGTPQPGTYGAPAPTYGTPAATTPGQPDGLGWSAPGGSPQATTPGGFPAPAESTPYTPLTDSTPSTPSADSTAPTPSTPPTLPGATAYGWQPPASDDQHQ